MLLRTGPLPSSQSSLHTLPPAGCGRIPPAWGSPACLVQRAGGRPALPLLSSRYPDFPRRPCAWPGGRREGLPPSAALPWTLRPEGPPLFPSPGPGRSAGQAPDGQYGPPLLSSGHAPPLFSEHAPLLSPEHDLPSGFAPGRPLPRRRPDRHL